MVGNLSHPTHAKITVEELQTVEEHVSESYYGPELEIIDKTLNRFRLNDDIVEIAMKVAVIDVTNSTQLSKYKSKVSLYDLAKIIAGIRNFDERVSKGDETLVSEISKAAKELVRDKAGNPIGVNLFSFASKYCHYHNRFIYGRDDYSIYDSVVSEHLFEFSLSSRPILKGTPNKWRENMDYQAYNEYIGEILDDAGVNIAGRRRLFDHYMWYRNR